METSTFAPSLTKYRSIFLCRLSVILEIFLLISPLTLRFLIAFFILIRGGISITQQYRIFTIVKDKELITQLTQAIEGETGRQDYNFFNPTPILLISVPDTSRYSLFEVAAASKNILLAVTTLDLGSVLTSQINGISDQPRVCKILNKLSLLSDYHCFNVMALGYPFEHHEVKERTEKIQLI